MDIVIMYTVVAFFYVISPGPAVFLAISNGMSMDMKAVSLSSLGNVLGLLFLSSVSIIGLGTLVLASSTLFMVVKFVGAAYLIYLGYKQLKSSQAFKDNKESVELRDKKAYRFYFLEGFLLAATNPKPILFFIAIFPQFLDVKSALLPQFILLTGIFMAISFGSLFSYGFLAKTSKRFFANNKAMKWFHRITGGLFIGMGCGLLQLKNSS